mmetsp:Transcript_28021/g.75924  ORF Transcript_28021/g.75924 Transcript_28021/m.75924 type:complete len:309 (-) Transcript_28021:241-1167(-)
MHETGSPSLNTGSASTLLLTISAPHHARVSSPHTFSCRAMGGNGSYARSLPFAPPLPPPAALAAASAAFAALDAAADAARANFRDSFVPPLLLGLLDPPISPLLTRSTRSAVGSGGGGGGSGSGAFSASLSSRSLDDVRRRVVLVVVAGGAEAILVLALGVSFLSFFDGEGFDVDLSPPSRSRLRLTFSRGLIPPPSFGHATTSALLGVAIDEVDRGVLVLVVLTLTTGRTVSSSDSASGSTPSAFVPDAGHATNRVTSLRARLRRRALIMMPVRVHEASSGTSTSIRGIEEPSGVQKPRGSRIRARF